MTITQDQDHDLDAILAGFDGIPAEKLERIAGTALAHSVALYRERLAAGGPAAAAKAFNSSI